MFDALIQLSIQNRLPVTVAALLLMLWGGWTAARLPVDVFPDLNRPTVTLMVEAGGLSPEEVEVLVTRPVEAAMSGAPGMERVRSQSAPGLSVVWVEFGWESDIWRARQQVGERVAQIGDLPDGVMPVMGPISSIMGEILLIGLSSPGGAVDGPALRTLADWTVRPRILSIPGVSQAIAIGGGVEQIHVDVDPTALARFGLDLGAVREAAAQAQGSSTGGFLERKSQEYVIRHLARTADPARIGDTVVGRRDGASVSLDQVAAVRRGRGVMRGDAGVNGEPAVILSVQKQPGADTLQLTAAVEAALAEVGGALGEGVSVSTLFRQADFIDASIRNVEEALRDGVILVAIILIIFLQSARTTAITLTAIPLSFVVSALALQAMGMSVNTMTLGGLAVAIGELVDDAIVDVENVLRRLRENARLPAPRPAAAVVFEASREVRNAIVFSTILVVLVFVPLFSLSGVEGRLFAPLGVAYITSILASMIVSLTVTPALCVWLLPGSAAKAGAHTDRLHTDSALVRWLKRLDRRLLAATLPRPGLTAGITGAMLLIALASVPFLGTSFLPPFNEGTATINLLAAPGTSLSASNALGTIAEKLLLGVPEVRSTGRRTGRAEADEHAEGVHYTEIDVDFHPGDRAASAADPRPRSAVLADIRARLALIPGVTASIGQPISHRLDHMLSGVRAAVAIKVFGDDLAALRLTADAVATAIRPIRGLVDVSVEPQVLVPQIQVQVDRTEARRFGIAPGQLTQSLEGAIAGTTVGQVIDGVRTLDLVVRYDAPWRTDLSRLGSTPLVLPDGRAVPLGNLARIHTGAGPNQIFHEDGRRRVVISANTADRDTGEIVAELHAALEAVPRPAGAWISVGGQFERQREATRAIALLSLLSLAGMYAVLFAHFQRHRLAIQVLLNIPMALIGAVAAIWISGQPLSVATLVGFVTLCGIASRNTILMITHYRHLVDHEGETFGPEMVVRGSVERLVPVLMTALCAGLALLPLAFAGGDPGKEILTPVAQVILGGLISSTLLDIVVTPGIYLWWNPPPARETTA